MRDSLARPWFLVALLVLVLGVAAACGSNAPAEDAGREKARNIAGQLVEAEGGSYTDVTPQELRSMLSNKDFVLLNVHVPYEGEIEGTDLFIPFDQVGERLGELPSQSDSKIVVYCRSGSMSAAAATTLVSLGYTNVWNLASGMIAWEGAGLPLLNAGTQQ